VGVEILEEPLSALVDHATIPIAFRVKRVVDTRNRSSPNIWRRRAEQQTGPQHVVCIDGL
jgi:hypothetical protein